MARKYDIVDDFPGYRAREEETKLPPGYLVYPSQNVVTNVAGRVQSVKGYAVDGDENTTPDNGIQSNFDFDNKKDARRNIRAGFLDSNTGTGGKVQYRYKHPITDAVTWRDLITSLTNVTFSFDKFFDTTDLVNLCLFVNGDGSVYEWNGAVVPLLSLTAATITIDGTPTVAQQGFYTTRDKKIILGGIEYTYTGVSGTSFTGVTPDPTLGGHTAGDVIHQKPVTNLVSAFSGTGVTSTFTSDRRTPMLSIFPR
jgi:hypothetical protein